MTDVDEAGVRVQLLGPVRAWRGDDELELGGPQRRALLGMPALEEARPAQPERAPGHPRHPPLDAVTPLRQLTGPGRYALQDLLRAYTAHVARAEAAGGRRAAPREPWSRGGPPDAPACPSAALPFLVYD